MYVSFICLPNCDSQNLIIFFYQNNLRFKYNLTKHLLNENTIKLSGNTTHKQITELIYANFSIFLKKF